jgi:hypothetical protein
VRKWRKRKEIEKRVWREKSERVKNSGVRGRKVVKKEGGQAGGFLRGGGVRGKNGSYHTEWYHKNYTLSIVILVVLVSNGGA